WFAPLNSIVRRQRREGVPRQGESSTRRASPWPKRPTTASSQDQGHPRRKTSKTQGIQDHAPPSTPRTPESASHHCAPSPHALGAWGGYVGSCPRSRA